MQFTVHNPVFQFALYQPHVTLLQIEIIR